MTTHSLAHAPKHPDYQPLSEIPKLIAEINELFGEPASLQVRTIAAQINSGQWFNYATIAKIGTEKELPLQYEREHLNRVMVLSNCKSLGRISGGEELEKLLTSWRHELAIESGYDFQDTASYTRLSSRNEFMDYAGWVYWLTENAADKSAYGAPKGPFLAPGKKIFAESINVLAGEWFQQPSSQHGSTIRHTYQLFIPDLRGWITGVKLNGDELRVEIESKGQWFLQLGIIVKDTRGHTNRFQMPVVDGRVVTIIPTPAKVLELWLITDDGEWLDRYYEDEYTSSWADILAVSSPSDPTRGDLNTALATGESNHLEFKTFIKASRGDEKSTELLQTVIAFSNTQGGDVYIGVNDNLEPTGVGRDLRKCYAALCKGDEAAMEDAYVRDLKKYLADGIHPQPKVSYDWTSFASQRILRLRVAQGTEKPYMLASNGDVYLRTGANNRKMRQGDIPLVFSRR